MELETVNLDEPQYRVRLFLSVDLTGSTEFKARSDQSSLVWLKAFQKFYGEFPTLFSRRYKNTCDAIPDIGERERLEMPSVWKTIGDEILFVNRVESITHLGAYVSSFAHALKEFGGEIYGSHKLNTKGNGWVAAFPSPNCSIRVSGVGESPLSGEEEILTEQFESKVDKEPHKFDFLGKGIDGGFRISRNSTIDTFTISPALAYLLCRARRNIEITKFECEFQFHEPQQLKGVVSGNMYPIVSIDTNRDEQRKKISVLQSELLHQPVHADSAKLAAYLEQYIDYHGIEKPALKIADRNVEVDKPQYYQNYIKEWREDAKQIDSGKEVIESDGDAGKVPTAEIDDAQSAVHKFIEVIGGSLPENSK